MISILAYLSVAIITALFTKLSMSDKYSKKIRIVCMIIAIVLPSVFAGIRQGIGTDYDIHEAVFKQIDNHEPITEKKVPEIGYVLLNQIVSFLGGNFNVLLFVITLLSMLCIYQTCKFYKNKINVFIAMLAYMLLYYQMSFNFIRQMLAASIALYGTTYLAQGKKIKSLLWCIVAGCMHNTAFFYIPIILIYSFLTNERYRKWKNVAYVVCTVLVFTYPIFILPMLEVVEDWIPSLEYFFNYLAVDYEELGIGILRYPLLFILPTVLLFKDVKKEKAMLGYFEINMIGFILWLTSYVAKMEFYRFSYTFLISMIILMAYNWKQIQVHPISIGLSKIKNEKLKGIITYLEKHQVVIYRGSMLILLVFFWYYDYFYLGAHETVPYVTIFR